MAESPAKGESGGPAYSPKNLGDPDSGTDQVDLTLVQNAFPGSSPALAAWGAELMLLYVTDNGMTNNLQYTDIGWTRWDGTNWSVPLAIQTNTQAEFAPQVAYDGNGDAIAVWERVADPNFNQTNLTAMAAQMEIVWSRWSRTNGAWTEPAALTANSYLDHAPLLCGPMSDGSVLAVWTANQQNLLIGTNAPGNDTVLWAEWSAASRAWSAPRVLVDGLAYRLSQSLAGTGNHAVYAWTLDADGVLTNDTDQEVFFMEYTNSAWGAPQQLTTNTVADKTVLRGGRNERHRVPGLAERHEPRDEQEFLHKYQPRPARFTNGGLCGLRLGPWSGGKPCPDLAGNEHERFRRPLYGL